MTEMHRGMDSVYSLASYQQLKYGETDVTSATQEPEMTVTTETTSATAAPTGNLEITVSRAELLRELTANVSKSSSSGGPRLI